MKRQRGRTEAPHSHALGWCMRRRNPSATNTIAASTTAAGSGTVGYWLISAARNMFHGVPLRCVSKMFLSIVSLSDG
jgi:hypothetical protein